MIRRIKGGGGLSRKLLAILLASGWEIPITLIPAVESSDTSLVAVVIAAKRPQWTSKATFLLIQTVLSFKG